VCVQSGGRGGRDSLPLSSMERAAAAGWAATLRDDNTSYHAHQQCRLAVVRSSIPLTPCSSPTSTAASSTATPSTGACSHSDEAQPEGDAADVASGAQASNLLSTIVLRSPHAGIPSRLGVGQLLC